MPTSDRLLLLDTSAAVAFLVADHAHHDEVFTALADREPGLAGHAASETFSVLTRLPPPARRTPKVIIELLQANFRHTRFLGGEAAGELFASLAALGIAGGSVYDALVGATSREHGLTLVTRDRRALETYCELGIDVQLS